MSPTVFREGSFRFFFFSREESRMHVHVTCPDGEAKFWLEPVIALALSQGLTKAQIKQAQNIVEEREDEIRRAWQRHFSAD
jgi:hypothetical protein